VLTEARTRLECSLAAYPTPPCRDYLYPRQRSRSASFVVPAFRKARKGREVLISLPREATESGPHLMLPLGGAGLVMEPAPFASGEVQLCSDCVSIAGTTLVSWAGQEASMKKSRVGATVAVIAVTASTLAMAAGSASALMHRRHVGFPPFSALNFYSGPRHHIRYYSGCGYGDCPCLHRIALATRSRLWWDRYDACTG